MKPKRLCEHDGVFGRAQTLVGNEKVGYRSVPLECLHCEREEQYNAYELQNSRPVDKGLLCQIAAIFMLGFIVGVWYSL